MRELLEFTYPSLVKPYRSWSDKTLASDSAGIADALGASTYFTSLATEIADYKASGTAFTEQLAKCISRDSDTIVQKNLLREMLIVSTIRMSIEVEKVAGGNPVILKSSKMPMRKVPQPVVVSRPAGLTLVVGINPGELLVKVDGMRKVAIIIEYTIDPMTTDSQWMRVTCSTCSYLLTGLTPGKRYWVRVAATGGNNQLVWGDTLQSPFIQQL